MNNKNNKVCKMIGAAAFTLALTCGVINHMMKKAESVPRIESNAGIVYDMSAINDNIVEETVVEVTSVTEPTTTTATDCVVYKPSTRYLHRSTCYWVDDECYPVDPSEKLNARVCDECNPDVEVTPQMVTSEEGINPSTAIPVTEYEYIILCNLVAGEYGSDWVSTYDKGAVVATVIHRLWEGTRWTDGEEPTIYNVIAAPYQYDGKYLANEFAWNVTDSCKEAVTYALNNIEAYEYYTNPDGTVVYMINSFYGDGTYNWFSAK